MQSVRAWNSGAASSARSIASAIGISIRLERSGHATRLAIWRVCRPRHPGDSLSVLWERSRRTASTASTGRGPTNACSQLRELGVRPIVGLVHHGSGPRHTSLVDPAFPTGLAAFARRVAERYPWVDAYTPVNEPLTTARFSGLYGHWYPHGRDDRDVRARARHPVPRRCAGDGGRPVASTHARSSSRRRISDAPTARPALAALGRVPQPAAMADAGSARRAL